MSLPLRPLLAWGAALMIIGLNVWLVMQSLAPANAGIGRFAIGLMVVLCGSLLAWIAFAPLRFTPKGLCAQTTLRRTMRQTTKAMVTCRCRSRPRAEPTRAMPVAHVWAQVRVS